MSNEQRVKIITISEGKPRFERNPDGSIKTTVEFESAEMLQMALEKFTEATEVNKKAIYTWGEESAQIKSMTVLGNRLILEIVRLPD